MRVDLVLSKPFEVDELRTVVNEVLRIERLIY